MVNVDRTAVSQEQRDFDLKEYESLRAKITDAYAKSFSLAQWTILSSVAIIAWLMTNTINIDDAQHACNILSKQLRERPMYLPAALTFFAGLYLCQRMYFVYIVKKYVHKIEETYSSVQGWQHFQREDGPNLYFGLSPNALLIVAWVFLLIFNIWVGYELAEHMDKFPECDYSTRSK